MEEGEHQEDLRRTWSCQQAERGQKRLSMRLVEEDRGRLPLEITWDASVRGVLASPVRYICCALAQENNLAHDEQEGREPARSGRAGDAQQRQRRLQLHWARSIGAGVSARPC